MTMNPGHGDKQTAREVRLVVIDPRRIVTGACLAGVSLRQLARAAGWSSHTYLLRILDGRVTVVSPAAGVAIAGALGMGVDDLFVPEPTTNTGQPVNMDGGVAA